jgi:hypothetical protein
VTETIEFVRRALGVRIWQLEAPGSELWSKRRLNGNAHIPVQTKGDPLARPRDRSIQFAYRTATTFNRPSAARRFHLIQRKESTVAQPNVEDVVKAIAADTHTPAETVSRMYADTWAEYSEGARIMDYLTVLVAKRVRENLRSTSQHKQ